MSDQLAPELAEYDCDDPRIGKGLRGKLARWFRNESYKKDVIVAVFIRCICGSEHRVSKPVKCRCGAVLTYRIENEQYTPYATIETDTLEEWIEQGHPVKTNAPELVWFDWKAVRAINWPLALRRLGSRTHA